MPDISWKTNYINGNRESDLACRFVFSDSTSSSTNATRGFASIVVNNSYKVDKACTSGSDLEVGTLIADELDLQVFLNEDGEIEWTYGSTTITVSDLTKLVGGYIYLTNYIGDTTTTQYKFYIDEIDYAATNILSIHGYTDIIQMDKVVLSSTVNAQLPMTLKDMFQWCFTQCGLTAPTVSTSIPHYNQSVTADLTLDEGTTYRQLASYCLSLMCSNLVNWQTTNNISLLENSIVNATWDGNTTGHSTYTWQSKTWVHVSTATPATTDLVGHTVKYTNRTTGAETSSTIAQSDFGAIGYNLYIRSGGSGSFVIAYEDNDWGVSSGLWFVSETNAYASYVSAVSDTVVHTVLDTQTFKRDLNPQLISVTGARYTFEDGTEYLNGTNGYVLEFSCNPIVEAHPTFKTFYNDIVGIEYMTCDLSAINMPFIIPTDWVFVDDEPCYVTHTNIGYNQAMTIESAGESGVIKGLSPNKVTASSVSKMVRNTLGEVSEDILEEAEERASELITDSLNGYVVVKDTNNDGHPDELLIMDSQDTSTATKVWRWNSGGLGYSSNGYNGTYATAITSGGEVVADRITTGTMSANRVRTGTIQSTNGNVKMDLDNGTLLISNKSIDTSIASIVSKYAVNTSPTTAPASSQFTYDSPPSRSSGQYIWRQDTYTPFAGTARVETVCITGDTGSKGEDGDDGDDGRGISSTATTYGKSSNTSTTPTTWYSTPAAVGATNGDYFWTKTAITYTDSTSTVSYAVAYIGTNGTNGAKGDKGDDGDDGISISSAYNIYYHTASTSAPSAPTTEVTSTTASAVNTWIKVCPSLSVSYPYVYTAVQFKYSNNTLGCSTVSLDPVASNMSNWCVANDTTLINGAKIDTGTITADKIASNQTLTQTLTATNFNLTGGSINISTSADTSDKITLNYNNNKVAHMMPLQFKIEDADEYYSMLIQAGGIFGYNNGTSSDPTANRIVKLGRHGSGSSYGGELTLSSNTGSSRIYTGVANDGDGFFTMYNSSGTIKVNIDAGNITAHSYVVNYHRTLNTNEWAYRVYSDGTAECWGFFMTSEPSTWVAWGNVNYGNEHYWSYPSGLFSTVPVVTVGGCGWGSNCSCWTTMKQKNNAGTTYGDNTVTPVIVLCTDGYTCCTTGVVWIHATTRY